MQLEALTGMDLGDCVISRNSFPCQGTSHLSCFLSKGTEQAASSMAKVQLVSVVGEICEDWTAVVAREGKLGTSC